MRTRAVVHTIRACCLLLSLIWSNVACGQETRLVATKDGLPSRIVYASVEDERGILWLSSDGGLVRYDGLRPRPVHTEGYGFRGHMLRGADDLFYCTLQEFSDSLERFDPASFRAEGFSLRKLVPGYRDHWQQTGSMLYLLGTRGVYRLEKSGELSLVQSTPIGDPDARLVFSNGDTTIYLRPRQKLLTAVYGNGDQRDYALPPADGYGMTHYGSDGSVYLTARERLYRLLPGHEAFQPVTRLNMPGQINLIREDTTGRLAVGYEHTQYLKEFFFVEDGRRVAADFVIATEDRTINIDGANFAVAPRLASYMGLYLLQRNDTATQSAFNRYIMRHEPDGTFGQIIRGITTDKTGKVWANKESYTPIWFSIDPESGREDSVVILDNYGSRADQNGCTTVLINHRDYIYGLNCNTSDTVPDTGYVYRFDPYHERWRSYRLPEINQVGRYLIELEDGEFLVACEDRTDRTRGALYRFLADRDRFERVEGVNLPGYPKHMTVDRERGLVWIGCLPGGLFSWNYRSGEFAHHPFPDGNKTHVMAVLVEPDGRLKLGTFRHGLWEYWPESGRFAHVGGELDPDAPTAPTGFLTLPDNTIACMANTPEGYFLATTFDGLFLNTPNGNSYTFRAEHGLTSDEFNTSSLYHDEATDTWYAGGVNGFVSFRIDDLLPDESEFVPTLTSYGFLDERYGAERSRPLPSKTPEIIEVPSTVVYFDLGYVLPDYRAPELIRYETRLVGFDPDWNPPTSAQSVRYTRLPPGEYTFELRAFDSEGNAAPELLRVPIRVFGPWYLRWWAWCLFAALLLGLLFLGHRYRLRNLRNRLEAEGHMNRLKMENLQQQLNPHFLSNSLNGIRELIGKKETEEASRYIVDFSRMMRLFLESSRNQFTYIHDEIDLLERYTKLEQLRFPGRFEVYFHLGEDIDPKMESIPSLILQPIVENAIIHGLAELDYPGQLYVGIERSAKDEDLLICTVADNGRGRSLAATRRSDSINPDHRSRATEILSERQELIRLQDSVGLSIFTEDLYPEREYTGTLVTLYVQSGDGTLPDRAYRIDPFHPRSALPLAPV